MWTLRFVSPSGQSCEAHMASSAWEPHGTFPARSRANPAAARTRFMWLSAAGSPCPQLPARPTAPCQQADWHSFHRGRAGQRWRKARRVTQAVWLQKTLPNTQAAWLLISPKREKIHSLSYRVFPNLHFHLSSDTWVSLHTQGKNVPQNRGVPGSLASLISVACPHFIYLLS